MWVYLREEHEGVYTLKKTVKNWAVVEEKINHLREIKLNPTCRTYDTILCRVKQGEGPWVLWEFKIFLAILLFLCWLLVRCFGVNCNWLFTYWHIAGCLGVL